MLFVFVIQLSSCKTTRKKVAQKSVTNSVENKYRVSKKMEAFINDWMGVPYKLGGNDKKGIDCSGLMVQAYQMIYDKKIPRTSKQQFNACKHIKLSEIREGDLVFFNTNGKDVSHVGMYLSNHKFFHASVSKGVMISDLNEIYFKKCFVAAGRI